MNPSDRRRTVPIWVKLAHASAPFLSVFLIVHLSAPVLATVGGSNLSSSVMLLGREYYQTPFGERYLLLAPFAIHVGSAIARRLLAHPRRAPRKRWSPLSLAGYTALALLPLHVLTHRLAPTDARAPIRAVGPAELDFEFVKTALGRCGWRSWGAYLGLVGAVVVHAAEGAGVIWGTWAGGRAWGLGLGSAAGARWARRCVAGGAVVAVAVGLWTVSREPPRALSSTVERYVACLETAWVFRA